MPIRTDDENKVYATCLVYNEQGEQVAHYHKIHLFDADITDDKGYYRESDKFLAGDKTVVVDTRLWRVRFDDLLRFAFSRVVP